MYAAYAGDNDRVRTFMERGADVNSQSVKGGTALMVAAMRENEDVLLALLAGGAHVNDKNLMGKTALDLALENVESPDKSETVRLLKEAKTK